MDLIKRLIKHKLFFSLINFTLIVWLVIYLLITVLIVGAYYELTQQNNDVDSSDIENCGKLNNVSKSVTAYKSQIKKELSDQGVSTDYLNCFLAQMMQESGGKGSDPFQDGASSSSSSITQAVRYWKQVTMTLKADDLPFSISLVWQSYNFGTGYADWLHSKGEGYSLQSAFDFSKKMYQSVSGNYKCHYKEQKNEACYGDFMYVPHIERYLTGYSSNGASAKDQKFNYDQVLSIMTKYLNMPYVWGGKSPSDGGFDCSGLIYYVFKQVHIDMSGNAKSQYDKTVSVKDKNAEPGDLVFFSTYGPGPTHVGMYTGNGKFISAQDSGVSYSSLSTWKKLYPFLGFRRIQ